ncbi:MAG: N-acetylmuramoyl-L-alanine amidase, partial [Rhizobiaceae bacterium]
MPARNFGERAEGLNTDILLLHYTGMETADSALDWLCREESGVSCHYFVFEDGRIVQMVPEGKRAWHAGKSSWKDEPDINSRSIGIEIANPGHNFGYPDFPEQQI